MTRLIWDLLLDVVGVAKQHLGLDLSTGTLLHQCLCLFLALAVQHVYTPRKHPKHNMETTKKWYCVFQDPFVSFCKRETNFIRSIFAILKLGCNRKRKICEPQCLPFQFVAGKKTTCFFSCKKGPLFGGPSWYYPRPQQRVPFGWRSASAFVGPGRSCQGWWKLFGAKDLRQGSTFNGGHEDIKRNFLQIAHSIHKEPLI